VQYALSDESSLDLAIVELIRYHDFLTSTESELDITAPLLALPSIPDTANAIEYAGQIRTFFGLELNDQLKLQSARQFYLYVRQQVERNGIFGSDFCPLRDFIIIPLIVKQQKRALSCSSRRTFSGTNGSGSCM
jgi:hypothetical protein